MSTESEEVYYTPQSSFSEEPENVIPTNIAQESQYYTPSKRNDRFDELKSTSTHDVMRSCSPPKYSPIQMNPRAVLEKISPRKNEYEKKKKASGCPVHGEPTDLLFYDTPESCQHASCMYFPNSSSPNYKKPRKQSNSHLVEERKKNLYTPLKVTTGYTQRKDDAFALNKRQQFSSDRTTNRSPMKTPTKTFSGIPGSSFYGSQSAEASKEKWSTKPDIVTIEDERDHASPFLSRSRTRILTRRKTANRVKSPRLYFPYEIGFDNLGNTCYLNATIQVLLSLPGFMEDFCNFISLYEIPENFPMWLILLTKMANARKLGSIQDVKYFNEKLIDCLKTLHPSYEKKQQQDADEFLVRVIEKMHSQLPEGPENPVEAHFQWELVEILRCTKCEVQVKRPEKHTKICLPILENSQNLEQCLEDFTAEEERSITCEKCQNASMMVGSKFRTLPKKLIMSINRYSKEEKVVQPIIPPENLDIRRFMESPSENDQSQYMLSAQIVHEGRLQTEGHYVSHIFCEDGLWRCYNDTSVYTISLEGDIQNVYGNPAYMYFYVQKSSINKENRF